MRRQLNIITAILVFVFGFQAGIGFVGHMKDFMEGFNDGLESAEYNHNTKKPNREKPLSTFYFTFSPNNFQKRTDSILNIKTGQYVPIQIEEANIKIESPNGFPSTDLITGVAGLVYVGFFVALIITFFRLIIKVNRSVIFAWENIRRIRNIGIYLIIIGIISISIEYYRYYVLKMAFATEHYKLTAAGIFSNDDIKLGLIALLVAKIFEIGVKLQEEQELTI